MCDGRRYAHYDQDGCRREELAKRLMFLILSLNEEMDMKEFTEIRLEMIRLIHEMV